MNIRRLVLRVFLLHLDISSQHTNTQHLTIKNHQNSIKTAINSYNLPSVLKR